MSWHDIERLRDRTDPNDHERLGSLDEIETLRELGYDDNEIRDELDVDAFNAAADYRQPARTRWTESDGEGDTTEGDDW